MNKIIPIHSVNPTETSNHKQDLGYTTAIEFTRQGKTIPEKLELMGFTKYTLIKYEKIDGLDYFTFSDWTTKVSGDIVTFVVKDGEIVESIRGVGENQGEEL